MIWGWWKARKNRDAHRYYLLPGMGGSARRRKERMILRWSLLAGLVISAALAAALYFLNQR